MDFSKLLDLDTINLDTIKFSISNRKLLEDGIEFPSFDLYKRFFSFEEPFCFDFKNENETINQIFLVSNKKNIPLFPKDKIKITTSNREEILTGFVFFQTVMDGLSELDDMIVNNRLIFKIPNVKKIQLIEKDDEEINHFYQKVVDINQNVVENEIKQTLSNYLSFYFSHEDLNRINIGYELLNYLKNKNVFENNVAFEKDPEFHNFLIKKIDNYLKTKDLLNLFELTFALYKK